MRILQSETNTPDAVENLFCKPFIAKGTQPMSKELSENFIKLMMLEMNGGVNPEDLPAFEKLFAVQVITKRAKVIFGLRFSPTAILLMTFICSQGEEKGFHVGNAVMLLTAIACKLKKVGFKGEEEVTIENLVNVYPNGFPSEKTFEESWDIQKIEEGGNLLDSVYASQSISFK